MLNETASPGVVDQADYDAWRANFGATNGPGSGAAATSAAVPEPGTSDCWSLLQALMLLAEKAASQIENSRIAGFRKFFATTAAFLKCSAN